VVEKDMLDQQSRAPLFWPLLGTAAAALLITMFLIGQIPDHPYLPWPLARLANGGWALKNIHFALPALLVGVGASLGMPSARHSMTWVVIGTALMAIIPVAAMQAGLFLGTSNLAEKMPGSTIGGFDPHAIQTFGIIFTFLISTPVVFLKIALPAGAMAAAAAIVIHLALNAVNQLPMPWEALSADNSEEALYELGGGAAIILGAAYFLIGPYLSTDLRHDNEADPAAIVETLQPPFETGPMANSAEGRRAMRTNLDQITNARKAAMDAKCDKDKHRQLKYAIDFYFQTIRLADDWAPGRVLSSISNDAVIQTRLSLDNGLIGWNELPPYAAMFQDPEKYRTAVSSFPDRCKS
jgi:hypothetical protein